MIALARSPNEKAEEARKLYKGGMKLVEIASQLDCSAATIRTWKNRYKWDANGNETFQNKNETKRNVSKKNVPKKQSEEKAVADEVKQVIQNTDLTISNSFFVYIIFGVLATGHIRRRTDADTQLRSQMVLHYSEILG